MSEPIESFGQLPLSPLRESSQGEKPCKLCFKPINARAKRCPFCHSFQLGIGNTAPGTLIWVGLPVAIFLFMLFGPMRQMNQTPPRFRESGAGLRIVDTKLTGSLEPIPANTTQADDDYDWLINGKLKNETKFDWTDPQIEVVFKDDDGKQVFATQRNEKMTIPAGQAIAFALEGYHSPKNKRYASFDIRIVTASGKIKS